MITAGDLAQCKREEIHTNDPSIYESVLELQSLLSLPGEQLVQRMLDYIKENFHYSILVQRAAGVTLQQLGNQMDITRERVRGARHCSPAGDGGYRRTRGSQK